MEHVSVALNIDHNAGASCPGPHPPDHEQEILDLKVTEFTTAGELAAMMDVPATEVIKQFLQMGMMVTMNQRLDMDTITLVADEFGFRVEEAEEYGQDLLEEEETEEREGSDFRDRFLCIRS